MPARLLGVHASVAGGLGGAVRRAAAIGCTAVQVFTSGPQQWRAIPASSERVAEFRAAVAETGIGAVVSHDSYLINLCSPEEANRERSIEGLIGELDRCAAYGIPQAVSHVGAHMGRGEECGLGEIAASLVRVLERAPAGVRLLMETTAGQGTCMNCRFEQLAWILERLGDPRLGVCLDTCHVFAAGYDIRDRDGYDRTMAAFGATIGFDRLGAIHVNDSRKGLGARVDRHANLGEGEIGEEAFRRLLSDPRFFETPILLETPTANEGHERDLAKLWEYARD